MKINISWLQEKNACPGGIEWFRNKYVEQLEGVEYQFILDALAKENKDGWAEWLLTKAGSTNTILEIEGNLILEHSLFFAGSIKVTGKIVTKSSIYAGGGIKAGWGIDAGGGIEAGEGIKAGLGIEAGGDYGIYVGISVKLSLKSIFAIVKSKTKPENLILGEWKEMK